MIDAADADSEILRLLAASSDQAATVASADDNQSLFGREGSPRLDVEIMDSQCFNTATWDSINDLVPTRSASASEF